MPGTSCNAIRLAAVGHAKPTGSLAVQQIDKVPIKGDREMVLRTTTRVHIPARELVKYACQWQMTLGEIGITAGVSLLVGLECCRHN